MHHLSKLLVGLSLALAPCSKAPGRPEASPAGALVQPEPQSSEAPQDSPEAAFKQLLSGEGLRFDAGAGLLGVPVSVGVKNDVLEYLLVGPEGKAYESLLVTGAKPSVINAGLLALGAEPGKNADWTPPTETTEPELILPSGDGFFLHVAWREAGEVYFFRVEDVISDIYTERSMRRHAFVFLGSRFASPREGEPEVFVADVAQNLINLSFFYSGNTLLTAALSECQDQTRWTANGPLLPPPGASLELVFSRKALRFLPESWESELPLVEPAQAELDSAEPSEDGR